MPLFGINNHIIKIIGTGVFTVIERRSIDNAGGHTSILRINMRSNGGHIGSLPTMRGGCVDGSGKIPFRGPHPIGPVANDSVSGISHDLIAGGCRGRDRAGFHRDSADIVGIVRRIQREFLGDDIAEFIAPAIGGIAGGQPQRLERQRAIKNIVAASCCCAINSGIATAANGPTKERIGDVHTACGGAWVNIMCFHITIDRGLNDDHLLLGGGGAIDRTA